MKQQDTKAILNKVAIRAQEATGNVPATTASGAINNIFNSAIQDFKRALGTSEADASRFVRICISLVKGNDKIRNIAKQDPYGVLAACMEMAALGLDPAIPNEASLVPFKNSIKMITGYKGVLKTAMNAAVQMGRPFRAFAVDVVYERDEFEFVRVPFSFRHKRDPFAADRGDILGFYAYACDCNGMEWAEVMTKDEVEKHQKQFCKSLNYSDSAFSGGKNFDLYGIKTVMMRLIRRQLPMSHKLAAAINSMEAGDDMEIKRPVPNAEILGLNSPEQSITKIEESSQSEPEAVDGAPSFEEAAGSDWDFADVKK